MSNVLLKVLTLLFLTEDRRQVSSLIYAVHPGILPVRAVSLLNQFVALCEQDARWTQTKVEKNCWLKLCLIWKHILPAQI